MRLIKFMTIMFITCISSVYAISLQDAKGSGSVVEKSSGYVEAKSSDPEVEKLVKNVNDGRKKEYTKIAKKRNLSVKEVAKIAAVQIKKRDKNK